MTGKAERIDSFGHRSGCLYFDSASNFDPISTHKDLFCDCHDWPQPRILSNGTDVAWPAGWTEREAQVWREGNNLAKPSQPGAGP